MLTWDFLYNTFTFLCTIMNHLQTTIINSYANQQNKSSSFSMACVGFLIQIYRNTEMRRKNFWIVSYKSLAISAWQNRENFPRLDMPIMAL